jgi:cell division protease FtsH
VKEKNNRNWFYVIGFVVFLIALYLIFGTAFQKQNTVSFSQVASEINAGKVETMTVEGSKVTLKMKDGSTQLSEISSTQPVTTTLKDLGADPAKVNLTIKDSKDNSTFWIIVIQIVPILLIAGFFWYMLKQAQGSNNQAMMFSRSKAKVFDPSKQKITFAEVAGAEEAKQELTEIVEFLKHPKKFTNLGAKIPKGVLLFGPPGTGKTLMARAVAGEANVPFFSISGSEFVEMFVGVGASRVRDLFAKAKKNAPCIIFIDEIDAVGRQRGAGLGGSHDEREQTLNQILTEMDGFEQGTNVIVIAATNRPDVLDPALQRPGRFDRRVVLDLPDIKDREAILAVHAKNKPIAKEAKLSVIARKTPGYSGADLQNVLNEAAIIAARSNRKEIEMKDMDEAVEKVLMGPERKNRVISPKEKEIIAYHEAGHAIVGHILVNTDPIHKISIISRGMSLGVTWSLPTEDLHLVTKSKMLDDIAMSLGGRVAEEIIFNEITTGASNDMEKATKVARDMVTRFGMTDALGPQVYGHRDEMVFLGRELTEHEKNYSEEVAAKIDREVSRIIAAEYARSKALLTKNKKKLKEISDQLIKVETIEGPEFETLMGKEFSKKEGK